jgi:hypothetical protein
VVAGKSYGNTEGPHGLVRINQGDKMFIDFCKRNGVVISNAWFKKCKGRLYTYRLAGD